MAPVPAMDHVTSVHTHYIMVNRLRDSSYWNGPCDIIKYVLVNRPCGSNHWYKPCDFI